jgi:hypothetical protein
MSLHGDVREGFPEMEIFLRRRIEGAVFQFQISDFFKIFILGIKLIENMILLVPEIDAAETILAALAIVTVRAVGAVEAILGEITVVTFLEVHALVTEFGFFRESIVDAIAA